MLSFQLYTAIINGTFVHKIHILLTSKSGREGVVVCTTPMDWTLGQVSPVSLIRGPASYLLVRPVLNIIATYYNQWQNQYSKFSQADQKRTAVPGEKHFVQCEIQSWSMQNWHREIKCYIIAAKSAKRLQCTSRTHTSYIISRTSNCKYMIQI